MSLGVKGGAVLYRRKQKTREMEDYRRYMEKLVNESVTALNSNEDEEMLWWMESHFVADCGEKTHE